ncbi:hypothetical protein TSTA_101930 [Talaromyces stipitatus ATCC 10500]|uniref:Uncharacterized protein n=1 Tax=Talaromyces stipitatus (strain ATCC 10500 / CBS 375.48 / QM 6759 / NRRL 1006) TaxID=441959 RepID=B8MN08_TALSN|nr:uncharacterized protein TSTA_101930 [Talaromyces stipitatus ATCC 10500]EED13957.1 hypothetical protein TSTA_101930 [Talaromyces stipitatus ATCC 10500]
MEKQLYEEVLHDQYLKGRGVKWFTERHAHELDVSNDWEDILEKDNLIGENDDIENSPSAIFESQSLIEMAKSNSMYPDRLVATSSKLQPIFLSLLKKYLPSYIHQNVFRNWDNGRHVIKKRGVKPVLFIRYGYQDRFKEAISQNMI